MSTQAQVANRGDASARPAAAGATPRPWVEVAEARTMHGLRLVLTKGVPNPWAEGAKALFDVKRIPFTPVAQRVLTPNADLLAWTGQTSAPVAVLDDESPRTTWSAILHLAERLAPEPALIPRDPEERARMFGYLHELAGEMGFGWCRRLHFADAVIRDAASPLRAVGEYIGGRYGRGLRDQAEIERRVAELLGLFGGLLRRPYDRGTPFFLGDRLTALDLYWATFAALIQPLAPALCPTFEETRQLYTLRDPALLALVDPILLEHRDRIYREYLTLPVRLR